MQLQSREKARVEVFKREEVTGRDAKPHVTIVSRRRLNFVASIAKSDFLFSWLHNYTIKFRECIRD